MTFEAKNALIGLSLLSLATPGATLAQAAPASPPAARDDGQGDIPRDIIVTATRREANVQDVPISVSVVSERTLELLNVSQTTDLTRIAPGLNFSSGSYGNTTTFVLRGVSTYGNSNGIESSVGVAVDGVPLGRTIGMVTDAVDISRIEVLRGPQGTLFGKNSTAGIISIVTNQPVFTPEGSGRVYYGTRNEIRAQAVANVPLIAETLALRIAAWSFSHDPYVATPSTPGVGFGAQNAKGVRGRLRWEPSPTVKVNYILQYNDADDSSLGNFQNRGYDGITTPKVLTPALLAQANAARAADLSVGVIAGPRNYATSANIPSVNEVETLYNTLQIDADIGDHTVTSLTSYQLSDGFNDNDGDNLANVAPNLNAVRGDYKIDVDQWTSELRLTSPGDQMLSYVAGLFFYRAKVDTVQVQIAERAAPVTVGRINTSFVDAVNYAGFGEFTLNVSPRLRFLAGGRVSRDDIEGSFVRTIPAGAVPVPNSAFGPVAAATSAKYTNFSWRVGAQYDFADRVHGYATVSRGYKGPGFNFTNDLTAVQFAQTQAAVKPEFVTSYEAGLKTDLFDRTLRFNVSGYYARYSDFQVSAGLSGNPIQFVLINAEKLVAQGGEAEVSWRPVPGLSIDGNVAYSAGKFKRFPNAPCYFGQTAATGCVNGQYDVAGLDLPNSPRWSGSLTARYDWVRDGRPRLFGQVNMFHKGAVFYNVGADPSLRAPKYTLFNVTAGIRTADDRYGLTFYGKNVFDQEFVQRLIVSGGSQAQILPYESRAAFGVSLDARF